MKKDGQSWYKRKLKQEEFVKADYIFVRSIGHQDRLFRVQCLEDGEKSDIYPPHHQDCLSERMQWFFLDGARRKEDSWQR